MDQLSKIGFTVFFLLLMGFSTASNALGLPQAKTVYTACLECSDDQIKQQINNHYQQIFNSLSPDKCSSSIRSQSTEEYEVFCDDEYRLLEEEQWVYFTDMGVQKGVKYRGKLSSSGLITIEKSYNNSPVELNYFQRMSELRLLARQVKSNIEKDIEKEVGRWTAILKTHNNQNKTVYLNTKVGGDNGVSDQCPNNAIVFSPFDYLTGSGRVLIDSTLRMVIDKHIPELINKSNSIFLLVGGKPFSSGGISISQGVQVVYGQEFNSIIINLETGYLIADISTKRLGNFKVNLNSSVVFGIGTSDDQGGVNETAEVSLSTIFHRYGSGGVALNKTLDFTINDPCLTDNFNKVLAQMGIDTRIESGWRVRESLFSAYYSQTSNS